MIDLTPNVGGGGAVGSAIQFDAVSVADAITASTITIASAVTASLLVVQNLASINTLVVTSTASISRLVVASNVDAQIGSFNRIEIASNIQAVNGSFSGIITNNNPCVRVTNSALQTLTNNTNVPMAFDTQRWNVDSMHSSSTNNTRFLFPTPGKYNITGCVTFSGHSVGNRTLGIRLNGNGFLGYSENLTIGSAAGMTVTVTTLYDFASTDYVELIAYQNSGTVLNAVQNNFFTPEFMAHYLGN